MPEEILLTLISFVLIPSAREMFSLRIILPMKSTICSVPFVSEAELKDSIVFVEAGFG